MKKVGDILQQNADGQLLRNGKPVDKYDTITLSDEQPYGIGYGDKEVRSLPNDIEKGAVGSFHGIEVDEPEEEVPFIDPDDDFELGQACDRNDPECESCQ